MVEFILEYIEQIVIALIGTFIGTWILYCWGKRYSVHPFRYHKSKKRVKEAGVVTFFYDRKVLQADAGTIGDYVGKAKMRFIMWGVGYPVH